MYEKNLNSEDLIREKNFQTPNGTISAIITGIKKGAQLSMLCQITDFDLADQNIFKKQLNSILLNYFAALSNKYPGAKLPKDMNDVQIIFNEFIDNIIKSPIHSALQQYPEAIASLPAAAGLKERIERLKQIHPELKFSTALFLESEIIAASEESSSRIVRITLANRGNLSQKTVADIHDKLNPQTTITDIVAKTEATGETYAGNPITGTANIGLLLTRDKINELSGVLHFDYYVSPNHTDGRVNIVIDFILIP